MVTERRPGWVKDILPVKTLITRLVDGQRSRAITDRAEQVAGKSRLGAEETNLLLKRETWEAGHQRE